MKRILLILMWSLILYSNTYAQQKITITGKVVDAQTQEPLPFVSVYLNNTTVGTTTIENGHFSLTIPAGHHTLIISFTGYEPVKQELVGQGAQSPFLFKLKPIAQSLQEVSVKGKKNARWNDNFKIFKEQFLGTSPTALKCKILNPEVLQITYLPNESMLQVKATDILKIQNPELGYLLKYTLTDFKFNTEDKIVSYVGYANFEPLAGKPAEEKKWEVKRQKAYNGSVMHFVRALRNQALEKEGFYLRKLVRIPNPNRPTDAEIKAAQTQLNRSTLEIGSTKDAADVLARAKLSEFVYSLDTAQVPYSRVLAIRGEEVRFISPEVFQVIYSREKEELLYTLMRSQFESTSQAYQHSTFQLLGKSVVLEPAGNFSPPLNVFLDGYWAWEKTGDLLPLDYKAHELVNSGLQDELISTLISPLKNFNKTYAQEKAYLHLDKPYYVAGETIWYQSYLVNGTTHSPDSASKNLYVELISPAGKVIKRNIMKVKAGSAAGHVALEDTLRSGAYTLRAYTNWMRNFSADYFFAQKINIWNESKSTVGKSVTTKPKPNPSLTASTGLTTIPAELDVQFFPEGGNLLAGVENKLGFKAVNAIGKGETITGNIVDETGKEITTFRSLHAGMGSFGFKPEAGKKYNAQVKTSEGKLFQFSLPKVEAVGLALNVDNTDPDFIQVVINNKATNKLSAELIIIAQTRGQVIFQQGLNGQQQKQPVFIPKIQVPSGITQITLFDAQNRKPISERLVFIQNPDEDIKLEIKADKKQYFPREKVELELVASYADGCPVSSSFSLAVTDGQITPAAYCQNIKTSLLLTSDLTGFIEQPGYYFENKSPETLQALDNLMRTQGWRRFVWKEILDNQFPVVKFPTERGLTLSGQAKQIINNKPVSNGKVMLSIFGADTQFLPGVTSPDGQFTFSNLDFAGEPFALIQADKGKSNPRTLISLSEPDIPAINFKPVRYLLENSKPEESYISQTKAFQKAFESYYAEKKGKLLQEVKVTAKRIETNIPEMYGSANRIIKVDKKMEGFRNILTALEGKDITLKIKYLPILSEGFTVGFEEEPIVTMRNKPVMILLDGLQISNYNIINTIHPTEVESVEIVKTSLGMGNQMEQYEGILAINLKKGNAGRSKPREGSISTRLQGYHVVREFYSPQYDVKKEEHNLPDKRSTLYWNPAVITDATGKAKITFYNADEVGSMNVSIEGVSNSGLSGTVFYRVISDK